ncbi:lipid-A-disaccharide synthase [Persicirhabdus sediminis]|uniref:Lipid-A-disaccharide synthase n=1 Tax=Persicirhabdus sediminis TaxID=454144 RepID=A0A8J7MIN5_9BACT|nr:lipid-A-disaccharide synthase [Persicirhabdus sediminis]MBK1792709.1 lipid-A-disaccharide synthase [Persicirhabdus sediminis]
MSSVYIVAGEVSGDTHGAWLMRALESQIDRVKFYGAGGPQMAQLECSETQDWVEDAAVMGIWEVLKHYSYFKDKFYQMLAEIKRVQPDVLVLIDYPGFNLRLANKVREQVPGIKIVYYISPQVWAWNKKRIPKMAEVLDLMLCIFPFEKEIFEKAGLKTVFTGHPLVDELEEKREDCQRADNLVALLPGSREREVARLFPLMVEAARRMHAAKPGLKFESAAASEKLRVKMQQVIEEAKLPHEMQVELKLGGSHSLMQRASCGVIASGTATLEAAALGMPYCLVYKIAWPTYLMAKVLVKIEFIGLANILAGKAVVKEFIQCEADPCNVATELGLMMAQPKYRNEVQENLLLAASKLGEYGAHDRAASEIAKLLV